MGASVCNRAIVLPVRRLIVRDTIVLSRQARTGSHSESRVVQSKIAEGRMAMWKGPQSRRSGAEAHAVLLVTRVVSAPHGEGTLSQ